MIGLWFAPSPIVVGVSLLAFGVGLGIMMPALDATIFMLVSSHLRAVILGVRTSTLWSGQTLGPVGFTIIAEFVFSTPIVGYRALLFIAGTCTLMVGVCALVVVRR